MRILHVYDFFVPGNSRNGFDADRLLVGRGHEVHALTGVGELGPSDGSDAEGVRWSLETGALCGTAKRVAEGVQALRDAGVQHLLCQLSFGYLPHDKIVRSMRRFAEDVMPHFWERR